MTLPSLPALPSTLLDALPARLRRRAEALAADSASWRVEGDMVTLGEQRVTLTDPVSCTCLLSPRCAHIGAVVLAAPAGGEEAPRPEAPPAAADPLPAEVLDARRDLATRCGRLVDRILERGLGALDITAEAEMSALLQETRAAVLPRLDRALTGVFTARTGPTPGREDLGWRLSGLALAAHEVGRDPSDVGVARRLYSALDGRGTGSFLPVSAEPVLSAAGFAGVVLTFVDSRGDLLQLAHTPPGGRRDVAVAWESRAALGDLHCSYRELSRHRLLLSGARTSRDGRIGRGKGVRAALGAVVTPDELRGIADHELLTGQVQAVTRRSLTLAGRELGFLPAARRVGLGPLEAWLRSRREVSVLIRGNRVLRVWDGDGEDIFPGLDHPAGGAAALQPVGTAPVDVTSLLIHWQGLAAAGGAVVLDRRRAAEDARRLQDLAAPVAAEVLTDLVTQPCARTLAAVAVYLRHASGS